VFNYSLGLISSLPPRFFFLFFFQAIPLPNQRILEADDYTEQNKQTNFTESCVCVCVCVRACVCVCFEPLSILPLFHTSHPIALQDGGVWAVEEGVQQIISCGEGGGWGW
jgi:hypothetical protein